MASSHSGSDERRWILPEDMRDDLKEIIGDILTEKELADRLDTDNPIITVGDIVTLTLLDMGVVPDLSIVDYQTQRVPSEEIKERLGKFHQQEIIVKSPAGEITGELWDAIEDGIKDPRRLRIVVDGEEDLAALVCILLASDGTSVIYGIPFKGLMLLCVDAHKRAYAREILTKMEI